MDNYSFSDFVKSQILSYETKGFRFIKSYNTFEKDNSVLTVRLILESLSNGLEATAIMGLKVNQIDELESQLYKIKIPKKRSTIYVRTENVFKNYSDARFFVDSRENILKANEKVDKFYKEYIDVYLAKYNSLESLDKLVNGESLNQSLVERKPFYLVEIDTIFIGLIIKKLLSKDSKIEQEYYREFLVRKGLMNSLKEFDKLITDFNKL